MIIDTHLHLIDKTALCFPWLGSVPALDQDFLYKTYHAEALRCGIASALHMEADVAPVDMQAETDYVRGVASRNVDRIKGTIAACRPEDADFPAYLEKTISDSFVKGLRRVLHVVPDDVSEGALFRENLKRLSGIGLTFDLCVSPRQLEKAAALADSAPDVQFILDHCGAPDIKSGAWGPWKAGIIDLAKRPNVVAKISGLLAYTDGEAWSAAMLRPYIEYVIDAFGWDRVVWGSDWPVCTLGGGMTAWVAATYAALEGCSVDERASLLSQNARRIWRL